MDNTVDRPNIPSISLKVIGNVKVECDCHDDVLLGTTAEVKSLGLRIVITPQRHTFVQQKSIIYDERVSVPYGGPTPKRDSATCTGTTGDVLSPTPVLRPLESATHRMLFLISLGEKRNPSVGRIHPVSLCTGLPLLLLLHHSSREKSTDLVGWLHPYPGIPEWVRRLVGALHGGARREGCMLRRRCVRPMGSVCQPPSYRTFFRHVIALLYGNFDSVGYVCFRGTEGISRKARDLLRQWKSQGCRSQIGGGGKREGWMMGERG
jgi:hypothetical protein